MLVGLQKELSSVNVMGLVSVVVVPQESWQTRQAGRASLRALPPAPAFPPRASASFLGAAPTAGLLGAAPGFRDFLGVPEQK